MSSSLGTEIVREIIELETVDSTNTFALSSGKAGLLVIASEQTSGRGRKGRPWFSPKGSNVYMTLTVGMTDPRLSIVTGVAVREAIAGLIDGAAPVEIKWPNDILIDGKKVCGILCESRKITAIGIGINVGKQSWPPDLEGKAVSLAEILGRDPARDHVLKKVVLCLDAWFALFSRKGFGPAREAFVEHGLLKSHAITTEDGVPCEIVDLDVHGHLIIRASGTLRDLVSGSILLVA
ncbi:MAG TPA: biotin--[acetyl-CoA-carboxylase] ligase [Deltaproteobacteria bacterium]|jgi:BirA family biotin operon repressor/biotin-[acetyl-CoA-carboxylase] ligase|nr:biotin--[acetyl-CoA-carboxylase] ligase [Deltaproteobacteria bacterium]HQI00472.1 biotin--[acetyl-CoA-carboxylase] ligase [Deltaproteobacteria bacterium]HQJ07367.1 biotin--[acetyl-CoA-carboxylase] ligase [Deltaproteobacteria bacterium]